MDVFGLQHLTNILYREDDLKERTRLAFRWIKEKEFTQDEFDEIIACCNEESVKNDKLRRYGKQ